MTSREGCPTYDVSDPSEATESITKGDLRDVFSLKTGTVRERDSAGRMADETHAHLTGAGSTIACPSPCPRFATPRRTSWPRRSPSSSRRQARHRAPIDNGFYYDFYETPFTEEDLGRLEERMRDLAKADYPIVREERSRTDAIRYYQSTTSRSRWRSWRRCRPT